MGIYTIQSLLMGIKCLTQLLKDKAPSSIKQVNICEFTGKRFAIDTSIFVYRSLSNVRYQGDYLRNKEGKIVSHIIGLFDKSVHYLSFGIQPIYVLDGKPPPEKWACIQERNKKAQECKDQLDTADATGVMLASDKEKLEKGTIRINKYHIQDLQTLFHLMGVSYIQSDSEAESYAGELCRMGYVDAVVSEDMDTLVYGCYTLIRKCLDRKEKRKEVVTTFQLSMALEELQLTLSEFRDLCILCGCDYCTTIPKIGYQRAYQHIQTYKSIEGMIDSGKFEIPESFLNSYQGARDLFTMYMDKLPKESIPIMSSTIDYEKLQDYLVNECGMSLKRVMTSLGKIKRAQTHLIQSPLSPNSPFANSPVLAST